MVFLLWYDLQKPLFQLYPYGEGKAWRLPCYGSGYQITRLFDLPKTTIYVPVVVFAFVALVTQPSEIGSTWIEAMQEHHLYHLLTIGAGKT